MPLVLPIAAAAPLTGLLDGPPVQARVALVGAHAAYLVVEGSARVVVVATPGAVVPPCAVVLPRGHDPRDLLLPSAVVTLGAGRIRCGERHLVVRRWWAPAALPLGLPDAAAVRRAAVLLDRSPRPSHAAGRRTALLAARPAARALMAGSTGAAADHLLAVLGLGPGSTPTGDDVAAGVLLGARAVGVPTPAVDRLGALLVDAAAVRTTPVSAGLLAEAAAGRAAPPVLGLVRALLGRGDVEVAVPRLLDLGHTSGADIAAGLLAVTAASARPLRRSA